MLLDFHTRWNLFWDNMYYPQDSTNSMTLVGHFFLDLKAMSDG